MMNLTVWEGCRVKFYPCILIPMHFYGSVTAVAVTSFVLRLMVIR